jgi:hypothetical protein
LDGRHFNRDRNSAPAFIGAALSMTASNERSTRSQVPASTHNSRSTQRYLKGRCQGEAAIFFDTLQGTVPAFAVIRNLSLPACVGRPRPVEA